MNVQRVSEFFEAMSRNPDLQREFIALASRHGIELGDQLSDAELAQVAGGTDSVSELGGETRQMTIQVKMDRMPKALEQMSNLLKQSSTTSSSIISNLK